MLLGVCIAAFFVSNWPLVLCCDNRGACGAVIRVSCTTALGRALSSALWSFAAARGLSLWVEFVKSELNSADPPSRMCTFVGKPVADTGCNPGVPQVILNMLASMDSLMGARLVACHMTSVFAPPIPCSAKWGGVNTF